MSDLQQNSASRIRPRDSGDEIQSSPPAPALLSNSGCQSGESAGFPDPSASTRSDAADPPADEQPLAEQVTKKPRRSPRFCSPLDQVVTVELQLCLHFLDVKNKLIAARCSRRLLQAADHPFAWQGPSVLVSSRGQPQLGSLIRQSLLRHASIALTLDSELPTAEVAAIPRLRKLTVRYYMKADFALQLFSLPPLQQLQRLRLFIDTPPSALRLLPSLPAVHTLLFQAMDDSADWSWLPAMPALTDLRLCCMKVQPLDPPILDAVGQCARLRSFQFVYSAFAAGAFARLCSSPGMSQLRHLGLKEIWARGDRSSAEECRAAFSALAQLESLSLTGISGVDLLLPHLIHAPSLRSLTVRCSACPACDAASSPSHSVLLQLLTATPRLEVRLEVAATVDNWRRSLFPRMDLRFLSASDLEQIDDQWRELRRMGAEMERVAIVDVA